jgi:cystathionine beta-lyase
MTGSRRDMAGAAGSTGDTSDRGDRGINTRLVEAGRRPEWTGPVVNPPVWRASTHLYDSVEDKLSAQGTNADGTFFYGRRGAPTQWALADALTGLEPDAHGTVLYPSGVAALAGAMLTVLSPGDTILISDNAYEPSRNLGTGLLKRMQITARFFDPFDISAYTAMLEDGAKAVLLESPGSLTMEICDVPRLAGLARQYGAVSLIDNTWATPIAFPALAHGCDIAIMSLTKHVGGHSDVMMGCASAGKRWHARLRTTAQALGHVVSPDDAALVSRGLRTMGVRLKQQGETALAIARHLADHPQVARVLCPMLEGSDGHDLWQRDFTGGCGLFSIVLATRDDAARARFVDALELFGIGYSWGGYESLALPFDPAPIRSAMDWPPASWQQDGGRETGGDLPVRLAIGLEDAHDLIADLDRALEQMG